MPYTMEDAENLHTLINQFIKSPIEEESEHEDLLITFFNSWDADKSADKKEVLLQISTEGTTLFIDMFREAFVGYVVDIKRANKKIEKLMAVFNRCLTEEEFLCFVVSKKGDNIFYLLRYGYFSVINNCILRIVNHAIKHPGIDQDLEEIAQTIKGQGFIYTYQIFGQKYWDFISAALALDMIYQTQELPKIKELIDFHCQHTEFIFNKLSKEGELERLHNYLKTVNTELIIPLMSVELLKRNLLGHSILFKKFHLLKYLLEELQVNPHSVGEVFEGNFVYWLLSLCCYMKGHEVFFKDILPWLEQYIAHYNKNPIHTLKLPHPYKTDKTHCPLTFMFYKKGEQFVRYLMQIQSTGSDSDWLNLLKSRNTGGVYPIWMPYLPEQFCEKTNFLNFLIPLNIEQPHRKIDIYDFLSCFVYTLLLKDENALTLEEITKLHTCAKTAFLNSLENPVLFNLLERHVEEKPKLSQNNFQQLVAFSSSKSIQQNFKLLGEALYEKNVLTPTLNTYGILALLRVKFERSVATLLHAEQNPQPKVDKDVLDKILRLIVGILSYWTDREQLLGLIHQFGYNKFGMDGILCQQWTKIDQVEMIHQCLKKPSKSQSKESKTPQIETDEQMLKRVMNELDFFFNDPKAIEKQQKIESDLAEAKRILDTLKGKLSTADWNKYSREHGKFLDKKQNYTVKDGNLSKPQTVKGKKVKMDASEEKLDKVESSKSDTGLETAPEPKQSSDLQGQKPALQPLIPHCLTPSPKTLGAMELEEGNNEKWQGVKEKRKESKTKEKGQGAKGIRKAQKAKVQGERKNIGAQVPFFKTVATQLAQQSSNASVKVAIPQKETHKHFSYSAALQNKIPTPKTDTLPTENNLTAAQETKTQIPEPVAFEIGVPKLEDPLVTTGVPEAPSNANSQENNSDLPVTPTLAKQPPKPFLLPLPEDILPKQSEPIVESDEEKTAHRDTFVAMHPTPTVIEEVDFKCQQTLKKEQAYLEYNLVLFHHFHLDLVVLLSRIQSLQALPAVKNSPQILKALQSASLCIQGVDRYVCVDILKFFPIKEFSSLPAVELWRLAGFSKQDKLANVNKLKQLFKNEAKKEKAKDAKFLGICSYWNDLVSAYLKTLNHLKIFPVNFQLANGETLHHLLNQLIIMLHDSFLPIRLKTAREEQAHDFILEICNELKNSFFNRGFGTCSIITWEHGTHVVTYALPESKVRKLPRSDIDFFSDLSLNPEHFWPFCTLISESIEKIWPRYSFDSVVISEMNYLAADENCQWQLVLNGLKIDWKLSLKPFKATLNERRMPVARLGLRLDSNTLHNSANTFKFSELIQLCHNFNGLIVKCSFQELESWLADTPTVAFIFRVLSKFYNVYDIPVDQRFERFLTKAISQIMQQEHISSNGLTTVFGKDSLNFAGFNRMVYVFNLLVVFGLDKQKDKPYLLWIQAKLQEMEAQQPGSTRQREGYINAVNFVALMLHRAFYNIVHNTNSKHSLDERVAQAEELVTVLASKCLSTSFAGKILPKVWEIEAHITKGKFLSFCTELKLWHYYQAGQQCKSEAKSEARPEPSLQVFTPFSLWEAPRMDSPGKGLRLEVQDEQSLFITL